MTWIPGSHTAERQNQLPNLFSNFHMYTVASLNNSSSKIKKSRKKDKEEEDEEEGDVWGVFTVRWNYE